MFQLYRPSGRFDAKAVGLLAGCVVAGVLGAWLYQRLVDWIPLIYVNVLATLAFGFALGHLLARALVVGNARSPALAVAGVVLVVLAADAASFHWAYRIGLSDIHDEVSAIAAREGVEAVPFEEFEQRFTFLDWVDLRVESGWTVGRVSSGSENRPALSGVFVYAVWLAELLMLGYLPFKLGRAVPRRPYCETCDAWAEDENVGAWEGVDRRTLHSAVRDGNVEALLRPVPSTPPSSEVAVYKLGVCDQCRASSWLDVAVLQPRVDKKGKVTSTRHDVVTGLELSAVQRDALRTYEYPASSSA
jgi:hypothetical protein